MSLHALWLKWHYGIAAWTIKKLLIVGIPIGTLMGAALDGLTANAWHNAPTAGLVGAIATTVFLGLPKLLEQRRLSKVSKAELDGAAIKKLTEFYERQLTTMDQRLQSYRKIAAERDVIATLERKSKHNVIEQLTAAEQSLQENRFQMRSAQMESSLPYKQKSYREMAGDNDDKIEEAKRSITDYIVIVGH